MQCTSYVSVGNILCLHMSITYFLPSSHLNIIHKLHVYVKDILHKIVIFDMYHIWRVIQPLCIETCLALELVEDNCTKLTIQMVLIYCINIGLFCIVFKTHESFLLIIITCLVVASKIWINLCNGNSISMNIIWKTLWRTHFACVHQIKQCRKEKYCCTIWVFDWDIYIYIYNHYVSY